MSSSVIPEKPIDPFKGIKLPRNIHSETLSDIYNALLQRPYTNQDLTKFTKYGNDTNMNHLNLMLDYEIVEKIPSTFYYRLKSHDYDIQISPETPMTAIPEYLFRDIPLIKEWHELYGHVPKHNQHINDFKNVCYAKVVQTFSIHPELWKHPYTTELFYRRYKTTFDNPAMPENTIKAIRAFLSVCHRIQLPSKSAEAKRCGLVLTNANAGKYRYIKLTKEEMLAAVAWLESSNCKELCKQVGLDHEAMLAHFSFSTEGFGRPNRVLTIESGKVKKVSEAGQTILSWLQLETKQGREYPKLMKDQKLISWASKYLDRRLVIGYKYLFVDDNKYVPEKYDTNDLTKIREKYSAIYKEMYKAIGKTDNDSIYHQDTLYSLRHIGVQRWVDRLGFAAIPVIATMGWEDINTLTKFYAGLDATDVYKFIVEGNYKGNDYQL